MGAWPISPARVGRSIRCPAGAKPPKSPKFWGLSAYQRPRTTLKLANSTQRGMQIINAAFESEAKAFGVFLGPVRLGAVPRSAFKGHRHKAFSILEGEREGEGGTVSHLGKYGIVIVPSLNPELAVLRRHAST